jgi:S-adenosylmethionine:tRNA ribosyltransferase-isomerase
MKLEQLDFDLPEQLIALHPATERGESRLLVQYCAQARTEHRSFRDLVGLLRQGDLLVLNDTQVVPARMVLEKPTGGRVEGLWLGESEQRLGLCMLSGGRLRVGVELHFGDGELCLRLQEKLGQGRWYLEDVSGMGWLPLLKKYGATPLPPYIRRLRRQLGLDEEDRADRQRYQTVWASHPGSVAAPTASLHLTQDLLQKLGSKGVEICTLTLHVGQGTFLPIETERLEDHPIHSEHYQVSARAATQLNQAKAQGRRIIAVGTTVCRTLESLPTAACARTAATDLFLLPGCEFRWVDGLLTNFHTPRSTLLALVAAFAQAQGANDGLKLVLDVYKEAIARDYRFYSYGDSTLWLAD